MPYATINDMVLRFGETAMIRLSAPDGPLPSGVTAETTMLALTDATALVDSYLRRRYLVPLVDPTADIVRATCILARYDLSTGADKEPSEQVVKDRDDVVAWLKMIADGRVTLEGAAPVNAGSGVQISDRPRLMTSDNLAGI
jgi:phage gp36-like protein